MVFIRGNPDSRIIGFRTCADDVRDAAPVGNARQGQKHQIAPGTKVFGAAVRPFAIRDIAVQRVS